VVIEITDSFIARNRLIMRGEMLNNWHAHSSGVGGNVNFARHNVRKNFFANRVVKYWNYLPEDVVDFSCINRFRNSLDVIDFSNFLVIE